jgi:hypothetical protein
MHCTQILMFKNGLGGLVNYMLDSFGHSVEGCLLHILHTLTSYLNISNPRISVPNRQHMILT